MLSKPSEPKNPRILLETDHQHLDDLLDRLMMQVRADDVPAALKVWRRFEPALLAHLDVEEMFVFPELANSDRTEVDTLRGEHASIREMLGEIGLSLELHTARAEVIQKFADALRAHAERERALAYKWAERRLPVSTARSIFERLKGLASTLATERTARRASAARP